jgi:uncharacterized protein YihD (DUF1040 family)
MRKEPRNKNRIPVILEMLEDIWVTKPDMRFGQIVHNLFQSRFTDRDMFHVEDDEFQEVLFKLTNEENNKNDEK